VVGTGSNDIIVSTPYFTALDEHVKNQLKSIPVTTPALIDLYTSTVGANSVVKVGFVVPVYGIQTDPENSTPIARIVGVKILGSGFFNLLKHSGVTEKTLEAVLVRREGGNIAYLTPLLDDIGPMQKFLPD